MNNSVSASEAWPDLRQQIADFVSSGRTNAIEALLTEGSPVTTIESPVQLDRGWSVEGPAGLEIAILLVSRVPLSGIGDDGLRMTRREAKSFVAMTEYHASRIAAPSPLKTKNSVVILTRGLGHKSRQIDNAVLNVLETLRQQSDLVYAVRVLQLQAVSDQTTARARVLIEQFTKEQLDKHVPRSFNCNYQYEPKPGQRHWQRGEDRTWIETYPDGEKTWFQILGQAKIDNSTGIIVERLPDRLLQVFIPDKESTEKWLRVCSPESSKEWKHLGVMANVE